MQKFHNSIELVVRSSETNEVLAHYEKDNAISDDFLCANGSIFVNNDAVASGTKLSCFLLRDDGISETAWANWTTITGGSLQRFDPWAPYCYTANNSTDTSAQQLYAGKSYTAPSTATGGRHKLFYGWGGSYGTGLPLDIYVKAIGLTDILPEVYQDLTWGVVPNGTAAVFVPLTLVVLPQSILVHGRNGGLGTPDVLEITYYLSIIGAS
jgi:hypothetical protein